MSDTDLPVGLGEFLRADDENCMKAFNGNLDALFVSLLFELFEVG